MANHKKVQDRIKDRIDPSLFIQWALRTTKHDVSPCCKASMAYISQNERCCLAPDCDRVWIRSKEVSHG